MSKIKKRTTCGVFLVSGMDMFNFACSYSCSFLPGEMSGSPAVDEVKPSPSSRIQVFAVEHLSPDESGSSPEGFLIVLVGQKKVVVFGKLTMRETQICKVPKERGTRNHGYGNNINLQIPSCPNIDP